MRVELKDAPRAQRVAQPVVEGVGERANWAGTGGRRLSAVTQIRRIGPVEHLAGRQALQRLVERPIASGSRDETSISANLLSAMGCR